MFRNYRNDLNICFVAGVVIVGLVTFVHTVDVRLQDGQSENQGRVEVRRNASETWGKVCDRHFGEVEASVICRQLNYKFSRKDDHFYIPDYPDYRLELFKCTGNESRFEDCIEDKWRVGIGECDVKRNSYASVCCSNSPTFGEMYDGMFVSHCADSWTDAEETCEEKKATLASLDKYKNILGSVHKKTGNKDNENKGYWTRSFFTPWLWSNGCFKFIEDIFDLQEFHLENNTVQACLQMCSIASEPTSFLLSGKFCRCVATKSLKSYISEVLPGWCNMKCFGDSTYFCGSGVSVHDMYWSLYTKASEDIFYKISDPEKRQHKQCAILEASRKLSSENCYKRVGYICGQILQENTTTPKLMFFQSSRFYEVYMLEARKKCTNDDKTMRLIGQKILEQDVKFSQSFVNLWVDISRNLADVYTIYWEPENRGETSIWRNLEPRWCMATRQRDIYYSDEVTACQTRFRYICSVDNKKDQSSTSNGSSSQNANDTGTGYNHNNSITEVHDNEITSVHVYRVQDEKSSQTTVIVAVVCGILTLAAIVVIAIVYRRFRINRNNQQYQKDQQSQEMQTSQHTGNEYTASIATNIESTEHIYSEIKTPSENIYNEVDALLNTSDTKEDLNVAFTDINEQDKEPVTMKRSYSSPKDLTTLVAGPEYLEFKDPNYIYPYDKVHRSDTDANSSEIVDQKIGESDINDQHNKQTVV